jgi:cadmium resistance protein CadD (predicted permease)
MLRSKNLLYFVLIVAVFALSVPVFAQTPVPIVVDTNQIFSSVNSWIVTFVPIVAIGLGIAIALAILTFIGKQILNAFQGGGRK